MPEGLVLTFRGGEELSLIHATKLNINIQVLLIQNLK
jgi:hypothetical protein